LVRLFKGKTTKIKDSEGKIKTGSIASLEQITLGGIKQWILIRGHSIDNPLLLFLHGGPGSPEMGFAHKYNKKLEKHFLFVHWDQRGGGKSFSRKIPKESMNVEQFIADTHELILYLMKRFSKKKIILVGHSWGTSLGIRVVQRYPELISTYVGISQVVNMIDNEIVSHKFTLEEAKKRGNKKAIRQLKKLKPPYANSIRELSKQRKWLNKFGGALYNHTSIWPLFKELFGAPEYTLLEILRYLRGSLFTLTSMWKEYVEKTDSIDDVRKLDVPVYFITGRYDFNAPFELVEKYYEKLQAPKKELIWFEKSAHSPNFEEPEKFNEVMIEKILKGSQ